VAGAVIKAEGSLPLDVASVCHARRCDWP